MRSPVAAQMEDGPSPSSAPSLSAAGMVFLLRFAEVARGRDHAALYYYGPRGSATSEASKLDVQVR
jgi:hypothetical protein